MKRVFKYPLTVTDETEIIMARGAQLLTVALQFGEPQVWALVDPNAPMVRRKLRVAGTGHPIWLADEMVYVGTWQDFGGELVFHLFDCGSDD